MLAEMPGDALRLYISILKQVVALFAGVVLVLSGKKYSRNTVADRGCIVGKVQWSAGIRFSF